MIVAIGAGTPVTGSASQTAAGSERFGGRGSAGPQGAGSRWLARAPFAAWRGRGDIDSVAIAPEGVAFAIETKTRTYADQHLRVVRDQAAWLWRRRRRWCRIGAVPVLCVVRARNVQRLECGVLVVSLDWLVPALRSRAGASAPLWVA